MTHKSIVIFAVVASALVAACTPKTAPTPNLSDPSKRALPTMERIALAANRCWFKSKDKDFKGYSLAPELNSYSGRPRILVVPARNPGARPLLVVQAEGSPARVETFGPMLQQSHGARISGDVNRWASGQSSCD